MGHFKLYLGNPKSLTSVLKNSRKISAGNEPIVPAPVIAEEAENTAFAEYPTITPR